MNYTRPNYDRAVFRLLPTILQRNFLIDLDEPHNNFIFRDKELGSRFDESDITIIMIYDALSIDHLEGKMLDFWKHNGGIYLSSIVPTLTGPAILSINAGLPPELTGFMNTKVYVPEIGNFIDVLRGHVVGSSITLEDAGVKLRALLWEKPVVDYIPDDYIIFDLLPWKIAGSKGLRAFYGYRSYNIGFENEVDALHIIKCLLKKLEKKKNKSLIIAYFSGIDTIAHNHGINTDAWLDILNTYYWLTENVIDAINQIKRRISIYFVSDHGLESINSYVEVSKDRLEGFLDENEIKLFSKSGRFAMIYGKDIDVQSVENFFNNTVNIIETTKLIRDFWPLAEEEKFMERAGDYTVLFDRGVDIVKIDVESLSEKPLITDFLVEMRKLKANHGAPTENELKAFFASHTNSRQ